MRAAIGLGDPGYSEELARQRHEEAVAQVRHTVPDLVDVGLHCDENLAKPAVARLVKEHAEKPFDALFLMQVSWGRPAVLLQVVRALPNLPMILYSPGGKIEQGVIHSIAPAAGAGSTLPILRSSGIKFKYVWSVPDKPIDEATFLPFLRPRRRGPKTSRGETRHGRLRRYALAGHVVRRAGTAPDLRRRSGIGRHARTEKGDGRPRPSKRCRSKRGN